jgi:hypothetical protein
MSNNREIAIEYATTSIKMCNQGGVVAFPLFPGATKHDLEKIERAIRLNKAVKTVQINKQFAIITLK